MNERAVAIAPALPLLSPAVTGPNASLPTTPSATRRVCGVVLTAVYLLASTVGPLIHSADHAPDHSHGPPGIAHAHDGAHSPLPNPSDIDIDIDAFRDPESGLVDFAALSRALGLGGHAHDGTDDHSRGHSHDASHDESPHHGNGSMEHFALALLTPEPPVRIVERPAAALPPPLALTSLPVPPRPELLEVQNAQGPPASLRS